MAADNPSTAAVANPEVVAQQYAEAVAILRGGDLAGAKLKLLTICEANCEGGSVERPATWQYLDTLAGTLLRLGERENARALLLTLLTARLKASVRQDSSPTLSTASVLVTSYLNDQKWAEALPVQENMVALLRAHRGEQDSETLLASSLLALIFVEAGCLSRGRMLLQVLATSFVQAFGREHPETLRLFLLLGLVLEKQGDAAGARAVIERSHALALSRIGEDHEITIRLGTKLGSLMIRSKDYAEARALLINVLSTAERAVGQQSTITLTNLNNLAVTIWNLGQREIARSLAEELVRRKIALQGAEHPDTRQSIEQLALMERRLCGPGRKAGASGSEAIELEQKVQIGESSIVVRLRCLPKQNWKQ